MKLNILSRIINKNLDIFLKYFLEQESKKYLARAINPIITKKIIKIKLSVICLPVFKDSKFIKIYFISYNRIHNLSMHYNFFIEMLYEMKLLSNEYYLLEKI